MTTARQAGSKRKGRPGLCPATPSIPSLVEPLDPAVDGAGAAEQHRGDGLPGVAIGQEQQDVGAESDLGVGVFAIAVEQRLALPGVEVHATDHGCKCRVEGIGSVYPIVQAPSTFPFAWTYLDGLGADALSKGPLRVRLSSLSWSESVRPAGRWGGRGVAEVDPGIAGPTSSGSTLGCWRMPRSPPVVYSQMNPDYGTGAEFSVQSFAAGGVNQYRRIGNIFS